MFVDEDILGYGGVFCYFIPGVRLNILDEKSQRNQGSFYILLDLKLGLN